MPSGSKTKAQLDAAPHMGDSDAYAAALMALRRQVSARLPDIDPQTLLQILDAWLRPIGTNSGRRFLLRRGSDGRHAP